MFVEPTEISSLIRRTFVRLDCRLFSAQALILTCVLLYFCPPVCFAFAFAAAPAPAPFAVSSPRTLEAAMNLINSQVSVDHTM